MASRGIASYNEPDGAVPKKNSMPTAFVRGFRELLATALASEDPASGKKLRSCIGVYAFYDFDGEPIYVGQTLEDFGTRIGRHLRGQRSDTLAYRILDPFEVAEMELYPLEYLRADPDKRAKVDAAEYSVYLHAIEQSKYKAILNEKIPPVSSPVALLWRVPISGGVLSVVCGGQSADADDKGAGGGFDDVVGDGVEFVDLQDALDLGEESFQESEVTSGDPGDGGDGLGVGEVLWVEGLGEGAPMPLQDEEQFLFAQGPVLVGEADAAVELGVVAELLLQTGHADQDEGDVVAVVAVSQQFQCGGAEAFGLIDDDQLHVVPAVAPPARLWRDLPGRREVLLDADVGAGDDLVEFVLQGSWGGQHAGGVEHGAALGQRSVDLRVTVGARSPVGQQVVDLVPAGVAARRERLAHAGWSEAQADGVPASHGVGELGEAAVFFGHDEALTHLRSSL